MNVVLVVGLDLSLTSPGVATAEDVFTVPLGAERAEKRLALIRDAVMAEASGVDLVAIEGYAFGAKGRAVTGLGELGGVVRLALYESGTPFVTIPPTSLKKYATGKGNAGKDAVVAAVAWRLGDQMESVIGLESKGLNDRVDAWLLRQMTLARFCPAEAVLAMPRAHLAALESVDWGSAIVPVRQAG